MNDLSWWFSFPNVLKHLLYISHISRFKSRRSNVDQVTSQLIQSVYGLPVCTGFSFIHILDFKVMPKAQLWCAFRFSSVNSNQSPLGSVLNLSNRNSRHNWDCQFLILDDEFFVLFEFFPRHMVEVDLYFGHRIESKHRYTPQISFLRLRFRKCVPVLFFW